MASIATASRLSRRGVQRQLQQHTSRRSYRTNSAHLAAQNFAMPAMSPTMTEGNISSWKVKEGDAFSAGDVLLEIETDKAQMDVEAQDDGVVAKITVGDGSKSVKVGSRIAVFADPGDDIQSLEIPPEQKTPEPKQEESKPSTKKSEVGGSGDSEESAKPPKESKKVASESGHGGAIPKKQGTLLPSVLHLLKEKGLTKDDADNIPASGPSGRLLKGDVLAYLGRIGQSYAAEQSQRISKLGHLDLSNIKVASPAKKDGGEEGMAPAKESPPSQLAEVVTVDVTLPISLAAVLSCQKRVEDTLGIYLPTSTFISRAVDLANNRLPQSKSAKPSANELFNAVLGLDKVGGPKLTRGNFMPEVAAFPSSRYMPPAPRSPRQESDVIDILTGSKARTVRTKAAAPVASASGVGGAVNVFTINVPKGEEKRAILFLERVKTVLEVEPGSLVL